MNRKNLILCGFMGCGKTSVGQALAQQTGRTFVDMDDYIETQENRKISDIFAQDGELYFRTLERSVVKTLSKRSGLVVATGGGVLVNPENAAEFKKNGLILLLDAPLDVIKLRLEGDHTRPLLERRDRDAAMQELYNQRIGLYQSAADFIIPAGGTVEEVVKNILNLPNLS